MSQNQLNRTILEANLTEDPKCREFTIEKTGEVVTAASLRVANNVVTGGKELRNFIAVEAVGQPADFAKKYLHTGDEVIIEGRLQHDRWEDKDGNKRSMLLVQADRIYGRRKAGNGSQAHGAEPTGEYEGGEYTPNEDDIPF